MITTYFYLTQEKYSTTTSEILFRSLYAFTDTKKRDQLAPAPPVLGQKVVADHDPADDFGYVHSDFDICPEAHIKSPRDRSAATPKGCEMRPTGTNKPSLMGLPARHRRSRTVSGDPR